jgi:hypothetical protein
MRPGDVEYRLRGGHVRLPDNWVNPWPKPLPTLAQRRKDAEADLKRNTARAVYWRRMGDEWLATNAEIKAAWAQHELDEIEQIEAEIAAAERAPVALAQAAM